MLTYRDLYLARSLTLAAFVLVLFTPPGWVRLAAVSAYVLSAGAWMIIEDHRD